MLTDCSGPHVSKSVLISTSLNSLSSPLAKKAFLVVAKPAVALSYSMSVQLVNISLTKLLVLLTTMMTNFQSLLEVDLFFMSLPWKLLLSNPQTHSLQAKRIRLFLENFSILSHPLLLTNQEPFSHQPIRTLFFVL